MSNNQTLNRVLK